MEEWIRGGGQDGGAITSPETSSLFEVGSLQFSMEICADKDSKRAQLELATKNVDNIARDGVHVEILISAGAEISDANSSRRTGGVGISNDSTTHAREKRRRAVVTDTATSTLESDGAVPGNRTETDDNSVFVGRASLPIQGKFDDATSQQSVTMDSISIDTSGPSIDVPRSDVENGIVQEKSEENQTNISSKELVVQRAKIPSVVNVHENSNKATELGAAAFAQGNDIHFAPKQFKPDTIEGQKLIGHELHHVKQQAEGRVNQTTQMKGEAVNTDPSLEAEADRAGEDFARGGNIQLKASTGRTVQRSSDSQILKGSNYRERIVNLAKAELGKVKAKVNDGNGNKVGSDRLLDYFKTAAPGVWPDEVVTQHKHQKPNFPSWCGIFSVWAIKKAGLDIGNWKIGRGVISQGKLTETDSPGPGDIAYLKGGENHQAIVVEVNGNEVKTIDGNSGVFSEVVERTRPLNAYRGFWTADGVDQSIQAKFESEQDQDSDVNQKNNFWTNSARRNPIWCKCARKL